MFVNCENTKVNCRNVTPKPRRRPTTSCVCQLQEESTAGTCQHLQAFVNCRKRQLQGRVNKHCCPPLHVCQLRKTTTAGRVEKPCCRQLHVFVNCRRHSTAGHGNVGRLPESRLQENMSTPSVVCRLQEKSNEASSFHHEGEPSATVLWRLHLEPKPL